MTYQPGDHLKVTFVGTIDSDGDLDYGFSFLHKEHFPYASKIRHVAHPVPTTRGSVVMMRDGCTAILGAEGRWYDDQGYFRDVSGGEPILFTAPAQLPDPTPTP